MWFATGFVGKTDKCLPRPPEDVNPHRKGLAVAGLITSKDASVVAGRSSMVVKFHLDQHTGRKIAGSMKLGVGRNPDSQAGTVGQQGAA